MENFCFLDGTSVEVLICGLSWFLWSVRFYEPRGVDHRLPSNFERLSDA
jgi:hypothetical protein